MILISNKYPFVKVLNAKQQLSKVRIFEGNAFQDRTALTVKLSHMHVGS